MYQEDAVRMMIMRRRGQRRARVLVYAAVANVAAIGVLMWFVISNLK